MPPNMQARSTDEPFGQPMLSGTAPHLSPTAQSRSILVRAVEGYLVDLLAGMLGDGAGHPQPIQYVIDAGGDLLVHTDEPITIALEDPADPANAVGAVEIDQGAFCASSQPPPLV